MSQHQALGSNTATEKSINWIISAVIVGIAVNVASNVVSAHVSLLLALCVVGGFLIIVKLVLPGKFLNRDRHGGARWARWIGGTFLVAYLLVSAWIAYQEGLSIWIRMFPMILFTIAVAIVCWQTFRQERGIGIVCLGLALVLQGAAFISIGLSIFQELQGADWFIIAFSLGFVVGALPMCAMGIAILRGATHLAILGEILYGAAVFTYALLLAVANLILGTGLGGLVAPLVLAVFGISVFGAGLSRRRNNLDRAGYCDILAGLALLSWAIVGYLQGATPIFCGIFALFGLQSVAVGIAHLRGHEHAPIVLILILSGAGLLFSVNSFAYGRILVASGWLVYALGMLLSWLAVWRTWVLMIIAGYAFVVMGMSVVGVGLALLGDTLFSIACLLISAGLVLMGVQLSREADDSEQTEAKDSMAVRIKEYFTAR